MRELAQVLRELPAAGGRRLLVGPETFDDAGVFRLRTDLALVQTVDFFPPMLDDPYLFGQIGAANSLSDVYAMAAQPLTALSLVCFPTGLLPMADLGQILKGAAQKCAEAGIPIVGGHSTSDTELKFGLSVTGQVHPQRIATNAGARPGDLLFLTKPLGIGALTMAYRQGLLPEARMNEAGRQMAELNRAAAEAMCALGINTRHGVHAATDVTGFGLAGHGRNLAEGSGVTLVIRAAALPLVEGAQDFAERKIATDTLAKNEALLASQVDVAAGVPGAVRRIVFDAETSGGLLIAVAPAGADKLARELRKRGVPRFAEIGEVERRGAHLIRLV